jgi:hypothetical protein
MLALPSAFPCILSVLCVMFLASKFQKHKSRDRKYMCCLHMLLPLISTSSMLLFLCYFTGTTDDMPD